MPATSVSLPGKKTLASPSGMTSPTPCTALARNGVAHIAMKRQSLPQSGMGAFVGQQGMSSGIAIAVPSTIAWSDAVPVCMGAGMAMTGLAIGPRTSPTIATMASRLRMADRVFTHRT